MDRRDFLSLTTVGGAVFASSLAGCAVRAEGMAADYKDFYFEQLSDVSARRNTASRAVA